MKNFEWASENPADFKILGQCALAAFLIEALVVIAMGWHEHWLAHPKKAKSLDEQFIEAQVFQIPPDAHLVEEKKTAVAPKKEVSLSKNPNTSSTASPSSLDQENQTESGPKITQNHGPVALYAPPPVLPHYLQNRDIQAQVVIDFYVNTQGVATPRLAGSSGDEELDALALESVKKWQFRPAEHDGKPIDAKVRLRIVFEVK